MTSTENAVSMVVGDSTVPANLGPRELRLLRALMLGPVRREEVDRLAGASNGPDVVMRLKRAIGIKVPCRRVPATDRDGRPCRPGVYNLSDADRIVAGGILGCLKPVMGPTEGRK